MEALRCRNCNIVLSTDMEIEYSQHLNELFCGPDCAQDFYFDYMGSYPLDLEEHDDVILIGKNLYAVEE